MANAKLNRPSDQKLAVMRNQASYLLWNGKLETTEAKAKSLRSYVEKILTLAINTYEDNVKTTKEIADKKGVKVQQEVVNDGTKKLAARRAIMAKLYDIQEQRKPKEPIATFRARTKDINHPLIEKIFNEYAPRYADRAKEKGSFGGYTRISKLGTRRGDAADVALIEML